MAMVTEARGSVKSSLHVEKVEEGHEAEAEAEALDWLGRAATKKHGGRKTSFFILANQALWNVANLAVGTNLVLYFTRVLRMSNAAAANNVTNWFGTMWLVTLLGGFLGDSYWGRLWTCVVFQVVHIVGLVLLALSVTLKGLKPTPCPVPGSLSCPPPSGACVTVFFIAIYIITLGSGGYLPAFQALGADQFDSEREKTYFFGWLLFSTNVGAIFANTVFVFLENEGRWALGYWLTTGVGLVAFLVFAAGIGTYRQYRVGGNPFTRAARVFVAVARKWSVQVPDDAGELHEVAEKELVRQGSKKLEHTPKFRFLDKAATKVVGEDEKQQDPWRLSSVTHVEEVKSLCRMLPIWLCAILFSAVFSQINTLFVEQAAAMDTHLGRFRVPPASLSVFNVLSIFACTVAYPHTVVPAARALTRRREGLSQLQRMAVGQLVAALGIAAAALLESRRLRVAPRQLSVMWQVPQQVILGASQVLVVVGAMDFFYTEAPHAMRGIVSALSLANLALGSYASSVLVSIVVRLSSGAGKRPGWIPAGDLNRGHLDYFFWLLFVLTLLNTAMFVAAALWYRSSSSSSSPPLPLPASAASPSSLPPASSVHPSTSPHPLH